MPFVTGWDDFDYQPLGNGQVRLQNHLWYKDDKLGLIHVPAGFVFDLSSYWLSRPVFDRLGKCQRGAALHDFFYRERPRFKGEIISKFDADRIYRQAIAEDGVGYAGRSVRWLGVAIGGWVPWWRRSRELRRYASISPDS